MRFGLVCASDHSLARQARTPTIAGVCAQNFVRNNLCEAIESSEFHDAVSTVEISVHNTLSLIAMVRQGTWVTVLPQTVARFMPEALAFRPISGLDARRRVFLHLRERSQFPDLSKQFCFILTERLDDDLRT